MKLFKKLSAAALAFLALQSPTTLAAPAPYKIGADSLELGRGANSVDKYFLIRNGSSPEPALRYNVTSNTWEFSNDGVIWSAFGSGSGLGGPDINLLETKLQNERYGVVTNDIDYSVGTGFPVSVPGPFLAGASAPNGDSVGYLLENYTASSTTMSLVWNAKCLVATTGLCSDATEHGKTESVTGWAAESDGASLVLNTSNFKLGAASLQFNKAGAGTYAGIVKDLGASGQIGIPSNTDLWFEIYLPSITDLTDVAIEVDTDGTNLCKFTKTTNSSGSPLAIGWNRMHVDLTTGCVASGTGWTPGTPFRYFHFGVDTGSSATTYSGILGDAFLFGTITPSAFFNVGDTLRINGSTPLYFTFDASNTSFAGPVTIANAPGSSFGADNTYANFITRDFFTVTGGGTGAYPVPGASGPQATYVKAALKSSVSSKKLTASVSVNTPMVLTVLSVPTVNQITVSDEVNFSGSITSGTTMDVLRVIPVGFNKNNYVSRSIALQVSSSSNSLGVTTINTSNSNAGIQVGDVVVFRHPSVDYSLGALGSNESFSPLNFVELIGHDIGLPYPNNNTAWGHWNLGGYSNGLAEKNLIGPAPALTLGGTLNIAFPFKNGLYGASGFSGTNYYVINNADFNLPMGGQAIPVFSGSVWVYLPSAPSDGTAILDDNNGNPISQGWSITVNTTSTAACFNTNPNNVPTSVCQSGLIYGGWNHIAFSFNSAGQQRIWTNDALASGSGSRGINSSSANFGIGIPIGIGHAQLSNNAAIADLILWSNSELVQTQVDAIYNKGLAIPFGLAGGFTYRFDASGLAGQALSLRANWSVPAYGFISNWGGILQ